MDAVSNTRPGNVAEESSVPVTERSPSPKNVLIVGVGGQGVIMVSKVLALLSQQHGYQVKQSEVHGMAKRGGSVFSHVRFGRVVHSPTIPMGETDILVALEWVEGLRWLPYLKAQNGTFIADTQQIIPPFACRNRKRGAPSGYAPGTVDEIVSQVPNCFALNATDMATRLGNLRAANTVLLGSLSTALDFSVDAWQSVIDQFVPPKTIDVNRQAFEIGRNWANEFDRVVTPTPTIKILPTLPVTARQTIDDIRVEINDTWCKSCDICVKFCPERCLSLNGRLVAELTDPAACTGCRICEWLCPDFAIQVYRQPHISG